MNRSPYSTALNFIKHNEPTTSIFEQNFKGYSKRLLDDLFKMKMIEIFGDRILLTPKGYNSLSIEMR